MNPDQAVLNRIWCQTLLEELARWGVREVCVAPGSRSTPLTLEVDANPALTLHTHFDERGLGFLALGMAKASQNPVAVIVTSGTAVANLLPAIAESGLTGEKLVVLTSDRPQELVGCGANQAIVQPGIFSSHVTAAVNLPSPTTSVSLNWLLTTADDAMAIQEQRGGTIHFNCPFPEPLYSDGTITQYQSYLEPVASWRQQQTPYCRRDYRIQAGNAACISELAGKKGLVIIGSVTNQDGQKARQFARVLGWPVLCDPQAGVTSEWAHFDLWLQNPRLASVLGECETVVQFGSRLVSKRLNHWLAHQAGKHGARYLYVSPSPARDNQHHLAQQQYVAEIAEWVDNALSQLTAQTPLHAGWADEIIPQAAQVVPLARQHLCHRPAVSEIGLILDVSRRAVQTPLFIGNSLIVRLADMFSELDNREVYSNRGASGIDGLVATAAGV